MERFLLSKASMIRRHDFLITLLALSIIFVASSAQGKTRRVSIEFEQDDEELGSVKLTGLPALSADGRTLIARGEDFSEFERIETVQATTWGGMRTSYSFEEGFENSESEEQLVRGARRLKRMISNRSFRHIKIKKADRRGQVHNGEFQVEVKNGVLRFSIKGALVYKRRVETRLSRGAALGGEGFASTLKVDFVGAYVDPNRRVFVVSYGSGECDCACDVAPFYQLYRWDEPVTLP